jgi:hypothetical protein
LEEAELRGTEAVNIERNKLCFVVAPIGEQGSEVRQRSDTILQDIIEPVVAEFGYAPDRSDLISQPGSIIHQIFQRLRDAELVVADLTDYNPNVFYELAIRHMIGKPVVSLIEEGQRIPFDVAQLRTIQVNHRNPDSVERCKEELGRHISFVEENPNDSFTPFSFDIRVEQPEFEDEQSERLLAQIDYLSDPLTEKQLREAGRNNIVRIGARQRILDVLRQLDKNRKRDLLRFLHEAALIKKEDPFGNYEYPVIGLDDADLSGADLRYINLSGDALYGANMREPDLRHANLSYTDMYGTDLGRAKLRNADLGSAYLKRANLRGADLTDAHLVDADLTDAQTDQ